MACRMPTDGTERCTSDPAGLGMLESSRSREESLNGCRVSADLKEKDGSRSESPCPQLEEPVSRRADQQDGSESSCPQLEEPESRGADQQDGSELACPQLEEPESHGADGQNGSESPCPQLEEPVSLGADQQDGSESPCPQLEEPESHRADQQDGSESPCPQLEEPVSCGADGQDRSRSDSPCPQLEEPESHGADQQDGSESPCPQLAEPVSRRADGQDGSRSELPCPQLAEPVFRRADGQDGSRSESPCPQLEEPVSHSADLQDGSGSEVAVLQREVERLQKELKDCRTELHRVQKQLSHSVRIQRSTESFNQDLRLQVEKLSVELHERKKKEKNRLEAETQTEETSWTEADYYNYYYGGYYQTAAEAPEPSISMETQEPSDNSETCPMATDAPAVSELPTEETGAEVTEAGGDGSSSIADMLRATAEEALTQTGFVFDETSGMYYDHATGFYYDSASQLYYDANTGMYYYYDPESGKYQFHSRVELPTAPPTDQPAQTSKTSRTSSKPDKVKKKSKRTIEKPASMENKDHFSAGEEPEVRCQEELGEDTKEEPRRKVRRSRSRSRKRSSHSEGTGRHGNKRRRRNRSHSDEGRSKKKKKRKKRSRKRKRSRYADTSGESEPEEGEITGSEGEKEPSSPSSSSSSSSSPSASPSAQSPEEEAQTQEEAWPPCVRVTVVRSPVLEPGTLFILTADAVATIGREKDMNHAIRVPEMGVSKSHAEVFFDQDQQCYMLVDQGSQNGTVVNGNRILQPKVRCDPCPLTHGDEVKLGETVLSFHIHSGTDTCDGCEPGQVRAHLSRHRQEENTVCVLSKEEKEAQRQKELKQIKIKYGLKSSEYEDSGVLRNNKYKDRAESRRQTVGSEGTFFRDDAPASLSQEINEENKGRQMLEKMGWKRGEGLGKDRAGITEPIGLQVRPSQSGLGSTAALTVEEASAGRSKKQQNWERARERFSQAEPHAPTPKTTQAWVKGQPAE